MALMNFIKPGTYTYIDNISFSKHNKVVQFILVVKEKNEILFNIPMNITANNEAVVINRIVTTAKEMTDMSPEFVNMKEGENYLFNGSNNITLVTGDIIMIDVELIATPAAFSAGV